MSLVDANDLPLVPGFYKPRHDVGCFPGYLEIKDDGAQITFEDGRSVRVSADGRNAAYASTQLLRVSEDQVIKESHQRRKFVEDGLAVMAGSC